MMEQESQGLAQSATITHGAHRPGMIVMAASVGGVMALGDVLSALPAGLPVPIAIVQHRTARQPYLLAQVLARRTRLHVVTATEGAVLEPGTAYLAPPDRHLIINPDHTLSLSDGVRIKHVLSSANPLFASAAEVYADGAIAVVLTGGDSDATDGVQGVKAAGGTVIAQDEATSQNFSMPRSAIRTGCSPRISPHTKWPRSRS